MMRRWIRLAKIMLAILCFFVGIFVFVIFVPTWLVEIQVTNIADDLLVLSGPDTNTTVMMSPAGILVVDAGTKTVARAIRNKIAALSPRSVRYVVNTSHGAEQMGGVFEMPEDAEVITSAGAMNLLLKENPNLVYRLKTKANTAVRGFEVKDRKVKLGKDIVHVVRVGVGHTSGDCIVYFPRHRVVATGNLYLHGYFPVVNSTSGGNLTEWIKAIDWILSLAPEKIIPGYGPVVEAKVLKEFQQYLRDLFQEVKRLQQSGVTKSEIGDRVKLPEWEHRLQNWRNQSSLEQNAERAFEELLGPTPDPFTRWIEALEGDPNSEEGEVGE